MADDILKSTQFLKKNIHNTLPLEEAIERDIPSKEKSFSKWFCGVIENKEDDFVQPSDYFDCWALKANTLANIEFLKNIKYKVFELTKEHRRVDEKIQNLLMENNKNLQDLFKNPE
jgi:hypothetical protein